MPYFSPQSTTILTRVQFTDTPISKKQTLQDYLQQFPQISKKKKERIVKELNLNLHIPMQAFKPEQLIQLHTKLEYVNGQEASQLFKTNIRNHLKDLKKIGLQRSLRVRRGLPIKGRTHSNGKRAQRSYSRKLINIKSIV